MRFDVNLIRSPVFNDDDVCERHTDTALTCCQVLSSPQHGSHAYKADNAVWTARMLSHGQQRIQTMPPALWHTH